MLPLGRTRLVFGARSARLGGASRTGWRLSGIVGVIKAAYRGPRAIGVRKIGIGSCTKADNAEAAEALWVVLGGVKILTS